MSLIVVLATQQITGVGFKDYGWRIPFVLSILLLAVSVYIRLRLEESPVFLQMQAEGRTSANPITESFARWGNLKVVLLSLFGAVAGVGVVWYTGQFYALIFMQKVLKVEFATAYIMMSVALACAVPFFVICGWISDKIGRKPVVLTFYLTVLDGKRWSNFGIFFFQAALTRVGNDQRPDHRDASSQKILATPCTVFRGEELCYLFVGRPAYKTPSVPNPSPWQLPIAFVVRFNKPPPLKHVHPFDSGAFFHKRLPSYITNFPLERFDLAANPALMGRLVSLMFRTPARYMSREPVGDYEFKNDFSLKS